jgi:O-antigen ligase
MYVSMKYKQDPAARNIWNLIFILFILMLFFAPNFLNRDYVGIVILYLIFSIVLLFRRIKLNIISILILIFVMYTIFVDLISAFYFPMSYFSIFRTFIYNLIPLISFVLGTYFNTQLKETFVSKVILFTGLIMALTGILQNYSVPFRNFTLHSYADYDKYIQTFETLEVGRVIGTIGNPNTFGVLMSIFVVYMLNVLVPMFRKGSIYYIITIISIVLSIYACILSQSRTALLALLIGIGISLIFSNKSIIIKSFLILLSVIIAYYFLNNYFLISRRFSADNLNTFGGRIDMWKAWIENYLTPISLNNILGYGVYFIRDIGYPIDNYYLQLILQYGLIGCLLYLLMFFTAFKQFYSRAKLSNYKLFFCISIIILLFADIGGAINMSPDFITFFFLILGYYYNK